MRIENPDGNAVISTSNILTVSDAPTWTTASGSLGTFAGDFSGTLATVAATSDSAVTFSEVGSNLTTANVTLNTSAGALEYNRFRWCKSQQQQHTTLLSEQPMQKVKQQIEVSRLHLLMVQLVVDNSINKRKIKNYEKNK